MVATSGFLHFMQLGNVYTTMKKSLTPAITVFELQNKNPIFCIFRDVFLLRFPNRFRYQLDLYCTLQNSFI